MKLDDREADIVREYCQGSRPVLPRSILDRLEVGTWAPPPVEFNATGPGGNPVGVIDRGQSKPVFVSGALDPIATRRVLDLFRDDQLPYLLIRVENSWQCQIRCGGEVLWLRCDEDQDASAECCDALREKCGDGTHPKLR